jgi:hypothetical protein
MQKVLGDVDAMVVVGFLVGGVVVGLWSNGSAKLDRNESGSGLAAHSLRL